MHKHLRWPHPPFRDSQIHHTIHACFSLYTQCKMIPLQGMLAQSNCDRSMQKYLCTAVTRQQGKCQKKNEHTEELLACFSQTNYSHVFSCVQKNNCFWHFSASKQIIFPQQAAENTILDRIKLAPRHQYSPRGKNNEGNSQKIILQEHCKKLSALRLNDANQLLGGKKVG